VLSASYEETLFEVACDGVSGLGRRSVLEAFAVTVLSVVDMNCWCWNLGETVD
jgi:hypothetical protein